MEDFFSAYQKDTTASRIVPLAMKAMEIKMEQEKFDMAKKTAIESLRVENEKKRRMSELFGQKTEEVTLPEVQAPVIPSVFGGNVPQFGLPEMKVNKTVQKNPSPMEVLMSTADLMKPDEFLKQYTEIKGKPSLHVLNPNQVMLDNQGSKVGENTNTKPLPEVNVANEIDTILGGMFPGYYSDKSIREKALAYYSQNPKEIQDKVAEYAKSKAPPQFVYLQTDKGFVPAPVKGTSAGVIPSGLKPKPMESDIALQRNYDAADAIISELETKFKSAEKSLPKDSTDRITGFPERAIGIYAQTDPKLASVKALIQASESKMIRALGEVGTLTDRDVARAESAMPTVNDTPDVRNEKFTQLRGLLKEIYDRGKRYDTTKLNMEPKAPDSNRPAFNYSVPKGVSKWIVPGEKEAYYIPQEKAEAFLKSYPTAQMVK